jgi:nucleotide-binding universal stress UspA family protein
MFKQIVVGTDGSGTATEAVRRAATLAQTYDARLHLVTAYRSAPAVTDFGMVGAGIVADAPALNDEIRKDAEEMLRATVARLGVDADRVEVHVRAGDAADVLLDVAEEEGADLIVVGNKGMTGARRFLLGSVPNKVAHHATCNVLIASTT